MNTRIKRVRLENPDGKLTQTEFALALGISGPSVAKLESGQNNPSEQTIRAICEKFGVRREWLETGAEPMYTQDDPEAAETMVPDLVDALSDRPDLLALVRQFYSVMGPDDWDALNDFARRLLDSIKKE